MHGVETLISKTSGKIIFTYPVLELVYYVELYIMLLFEAVF